MSADVVNDQNNRKSRSVLIIIILLQLHLFLFMSCVFPLCISEVLVGGRSESVRPHRDSPQRAGAHRSVRLQAVQIQEPLHQGLPHPSAQVPCVLHLNEAAAARHFTLSCDSTRLCAESLVPLVHRGLLFQLRVCMLIQFQEQTDLKSINKLLI